jgi:plastocyanin
MRRTRTTVAVLLLVVAGAFTAVSWGGADNRQVQLLDNCDGPTFNAEVRPGTCLRSSGLTFDTFIAHLSSRHDVPSWRFSPERLELSAGGTITATNLGGEFHTLTPVANFGGGCVEPLNVILGLTPVPECAQVPAIFGATGVDPGDSRTFGPFAAGTYKLECLIHPWMQATLTVS